MSSAPDPLHDPEPELPSEVRVGDERSTLVGMLDDYRAVLLRKAWGLDREQLDRRLPPSELTLGGLLKHMAFVEHHWCSQRFVDRPAGEPWASVDWDADRDWDFHSAADHTPAELVALYLTEIEASRHVIDAIPDLDTMTARMSAPKPYNLRWLLVHMIEEYARHCGHADLLRESIDGRTGD